MKLGKKKCCYILKILDKINTKQVKAQTSEMSDKVLDGRILWSLVGNSKDKDQEDVARPSQAGIPVIPRGCTALHSSSMT